MSVTVYLDAAVDGDHELECTAATILRDVVRLMPRDTDQERVVPLDNVTGIDGDEVTHEIEEIEFPGGRATELVTRLS
ncbi:MAG: hypothetical protein J07HX5_00936 [halophilic archaeon J07HX5]|jgi:hypothetical protein|nr:MAG: hypothetical protein J07HX5_00936 [halophilic archaeon J07HX5]